MSTALESACERRDTALLVARATNEDYIRAEAEVVRLVFLEFAAKDSAIQGFCFEYEYEYDVEGGYYLSTSVYPLVDGEEAYDLDEFSYEMREHGIEAIRLVCGVSEDAVEGRVTVAEARERSF